MRAGIEDFVRRLPPPAAEGAVLGWRVLIRRGLEGQPFPSKANERQAAAASAALEAALRGCGKFQLLALAASPSLDRRLAVERDLVPQAWAVQGGGSLALGLDTPVWCSVNETDHLRIRAESVGPDPGGAYALAGEVDAILGEALDYAFSPDAGYILAEVADWGSGLTASATLHLPALAMAGLVDRALRTALDSGLAVRGFWSDESASSGALYELETPRGSREDEGSLLDRLRDAAERISAYEEGAREELLSHDPEVVRDAVQRAYGIARYARRVGYDEGAETVSRLRLGGRCGMLKGGAESSRGFYALRNAHLLRYRTDKGLREREESPDSLRIEELRAGALREMVSKVSILEVP